IIWNPAPLLNPDKAGGSSEEVLLVEGTSLRIKAFCGHQHLKGEKVWCKEKLKEECYHNAPLSFPGSGWKYLTTESSQWIILEGSANDCISLIMPSLQVEDSGIYWFGILNHATFISLEKINVVIHKSEYLVLFPRSVSSSNQRRSAEGLGRSGRRPEFMGNLFTPLSI
uniref:Uncharacterized protein n=1 Tax=Salvator merianae TaxID=96440 RepID=A0A8D0DJJ0_SALMN